MWPALQKKLDRYLELEQLLGDPSVAGDHAKYSAVAREHGSLSKVARPYQEFQKLDEAIRQAEQLLVEDDAEMKVIAEEELQALRPRHADLKTRLEDLLLIDPSEDFNSLIMEIRAGTGGDEAALFAGDLYEMYTRFARNMGWSFESISFSEGEAGGFKEIVFNISGEDVYRFLRFESGGHRVQRVPKTETQGRIHTSAATVAILPEPDEVQVEIRPQDIIIETMRAGGAGGQHVNKTESAVRIWYRQGTPDQIEVKCQDERSQHKNRDRAMRILRSRVYEMQRERLHQERAEARRTLIGSGDRSERIRTYNFPENRLTDHRIKLTLYKLDVILSGELGDVIQALQQHDKQERLEQAG
jgi:peptide chain release factor 1